MSREVCMLRERVRLATSDLNPNGRRSPERHVFQTSDRSDRSDEIRSKASGR